MNIKVVWICSFSNAQVRSHFTTKVNPILQYLSKIRGHVIDFGTDSAIWNTNAIKEFEKIKGIELHVITPVRFLHRNEVRFEINGIHYYFFRDENSSLIRFLYYQLFTKYKSLFYKNRRKIKSLVEEINPNIVHVIGAENPQYSLAILDVPSSIPTIIQLQALLDRLISITKNPVERKSFAYKGKFEREIIRKADFVGTLVPDFRDYIVKEIKPDVKFLDISLAMSSSINLTKERKQFDFVYFAANISKAGDVALKAFALAHQMHPGITLNIVGAFDKEFKVVLDEIILEYKLEAVVTFVGKLASHSDVIAQIRKSKFALLPLKMDLVPNTIREAMCNGLPVVTTATVNGTVCLNRDRESVLLSEQGDYLSMANNMIRLLKNSSLGESLIKNAIITENEQNLDNYTQILKWEEVYHFLKEDR